MQPVTPQQVVVKLCFALPAMGAEGISSNDIWPNLKAQKYGYLVKQIKAFRDGSRLDPSMQPMVANLTDEDIENLAAYFSSMK